MRWGAGNAYMEVTYYPRGMPRSYFSASQTSSKRRFIQWLGCGV